MSLTFTNKYRATVSVCIMLFDPRSCPDAKWLKVGWWNIQPGQSISPLIGNLNNRYYYFYAQAVDGAVWSGPFRETITAKKFTWCRDLIVLDPWVAGFRELDTGSYLDYTVSLLGA